MKNLFCLVAVSLGLSSCASHTGVVSMGNNKFMITKQQATGFPGLGNMKAEIISEASAHCARTNTELNVVSSKETQPPYILGNYPRSEIEFTCISAKAKN